MIGRTVLRLRLLVAFGLAAAALACSAVALAVPTAPAVSSLSDSNVTYSSVLFSGFIVPHGVATNYYFQYGKTSGYGAQTPLAPAGDGTRQVKVSQPAGGLEAGTTYHFRMVASNSAGTSTSGDHTFTTKKLPLALRIAGVPNPVPFGAPFIVEGTLTGTGSANHPVVLQANPFPFSGGFKRVGNPELTSSTGGFSFPMVGLRENTQLRVQTLGGPVVTSPILLENVAVRVTLHVRRTHRHGHRAWRLYGTVTPAEAGALVGFQRLIPGARTVNAGGTSVKPASSTTSRFARTVRLRHRGLYRALVKIADGAHVSAYSAPVLVR